MSKIEEQIAPIKSLILTGKILIVDPSSGSKESQPGYAIFQDGKFVDSGTIKIEYRQSLQLRLYSLRETLQRDFVEEKPDVLVVENIPPFIAKAGQSFGGNTKSILALHKSVGVTVSCFNCPLVEVAPISWRRFIPAEYKKTDENDSIMMGLTVLKIASGFTEFPITPELIYKLQTGKWKNE